MAYAMTIRTETGIEYSTATGNLGALMDAAYDDGALGITAMVLP